MIYFFNYAGFRSISGICHSSRYDCQLINVTCVLFGTSLVWWNPVNLQEWRLRASTLVFVRTSVLLFISLKTLTCTYVMARSYACLMIRDAVPVIVHSVSLSMSMSIVERDTQNGIQKRQHVYVDKGLLEIQLKKSRIEECLCVCSRFSPIDCFQLKFSVTLLNTCWR